MNRGATLSERAPMSRMARSFVRRRTLPEVPLRRCCRTKRKRRTPSLVELFSVGITLLRGHMCSKCASQCPRTQLANPASHTLTSWQLHHWVQQQQRLHWTLGFATIECPRLHLRIHHDTCYHICTFVYYTAHALLSKVQPLPNLRPTSPLTVDPFLAA